MIDLITQEFCKRILHDVYKRSCEECTPCLALVVIGSTNDSMPMQTCQIFFKDHEEFYRESWRTVRELLDRNENIAVMVLRENSFEKVDITIFDKNLNITHEGTLSVNLKFKSKS